MPTLERAAIARLVDVVELRAGEITHDPDRTYGYVDFPIDAVLSIVATLENGGTCEVGTIGNESGSGIDVAFGAPVLRTTFCQVPGRIARMRTDAFVSAAGSKRAFNRLLQRATQARLFCIEQSCACNAVHSVTHRCARWMLSTHDRVGRDGYPLTQDFLAIMLGVRRASVTRAAETLHALGAIDYRRGHVTVVDRVALSAAACECYAIMTDVYSQSLLEIGEGPWTTRTTA